MKSLDATNRQARKIRGDGTIAYPASQGGRDALYLNRRTVEAVDWLYRLCYRLTLPRNS
mgnify:CR=1 FL=1